ncbi:MAG: DeoR/GlpR transcriptional regulator [Ruminococcaceae bacterium]|nr:DeoR/GlpR transcriptional regulator [Oscillospiraceae bacterium]
MEKRANIIYGYIKQNKTVTLRELCALFPDYNEMTIRRDLNLLAKNGYIRRTRGGAVLCEDVLPSDFEHSSRSSSAQAQKSKIALLALEYVEEASSVYFDSGTTVQELAKMLPDKPLFVTTNGVETVNLLKQKEKVEVVLTGGTLNKAVASMSGPIALNALEQINIDTAFMGAAGFSAEHGFTNALVNECELKRKAVSWAKHVVMLIDSTKFGKTLPYTFCMPENVDVIITDKPLPDELAEAAKQAGIKVVY